MSKDFAFLFYVNDWAGGTQWLTRLQRGGYIDLLLLQVNNTCFSLEEVKAILGQDFENIWPALESKFVCENGKYHNAKMKTVLDARRVFTESRSKNRLGKKKDNTRKTLVKQVEKENEKERENEFIKGVLVFEGKYERKLLDGFIRYWIEPDKNGKMRFEFEKTWSTASRIVTWSENNKQFTKSTKNGETKRNPGVGERIENGKEFGKF